MSLFVLFINNNPERNKSELMCSKLFSHSFQQQYKNREI
jgi:hypothetical protein